MICSQILTLIAPHHCSSYYHHNLTSFYSLFAQCRLAGIELHSPVRCVCVVILSHPTVVSTRPISLKCMRSPGQNYRHPDLNGDPDKFPVHDPIKCDDKIQPIYGISNHYEHTDFVLWQSVWLYRKFKEKKL